MGSKICRKCHQMKPLTEYSHKLPSGRQPGLQPRCKLCAAEDTKLWKLKNKETARERYLQREYGMSENEYLARLLAQNNQCLLCHKNFSNGEYGADSPVVDHCHTQGHVRGILCNECNRGLGYFKDNTATLHNAIAYLENN